MTSKDAASISIKSPRLAAHLLLGMALAFAIFYMAIYYFAVNDDKGWIVIAGVLSSLFFVLMAALSRNTADAIVLDDGSIQFLFANIREDVRFIVIKSDFVRLVHETFDTPDAIDSRVHMQVRNLGIVALPYWGLRQAEALGEAIGMSVQDVEVAGPTAGLELKSLSAWLHR